MANNKKNEYTLDRKRFLIFVSIIVIIIAVIIIIISLNKKIEIDELTNISDLNANKYHNEIIEMYNTEGMKDKFLEEYNEIQNKVGMYIINNSTNEQDSFKKLVNEVNKKLESRNFKEFDINNPTFWNGTWSIDGKAKLQFKFENKKIEPNWIEDSEVEAIIIKNK